MVTSNDFFGWLAVQPSFLEVALGTFFCLVVAPTVLAGAATAVTAFEALAETQLKRLLGSRQAHIGQGIYLALLRTYPVCARMHSHRTSHSSLRHWG